MIYLKGGKGMLHIIANIKPIKDFSENVYEFESAIFQATLIKSYDEVCREILTYSFRVKKEENIQDKFIQTLLNIIENDLPIQQIFANTILVTEVEDKNGKKNYTHLENEELLSEVHNFKFETN